MNRHEIDTANIELFELLYTKYQQDPSSIPVTWRHFFSDMEQPSSPAPFQNKPTSNTASLNPHTSEIKESALEHPHLSADTFTKISHESDHSAHISSEKESSSGDIRIYDLIRAYRTYGHMIAMLNPIVPPISIDSFQPLRLESFGFDANDLDKHFYPCGIIAATSATLRDIIAALKATYCGKISVEYMELRNSDLEQWLQKRIESIQFRPQFDIEYKRMILNHLNSSELLERFLHAKYPNQTRFSLEGGETLIPILASLIESGANNDVKSVIIGMPHRGRLNILANIMNKSYKEIFSQFEEGYIPASSNGSGDLTYHKGVTADISTSGGKKIRVHLANNPSHLEAVASVVEGYTRSCQQQSGDDLRTHTIPVIIHGDASIAGEGIVYETMQMGKIAGYTTGGTIHIVVDNNIGFTTLPESSRSTFYSSDIARTFSAPVFHVNAEAPEECIFATMLAVEARQLFHCDVFIVMHCYRKWGHSENDDPSFTQPLEYKIIKKKKPIREIYRDALISSSVVEKYMAERLEVEFKESLQRALKGSKALFLGKEEEEAPPDHRQLISTEEYILSVEKELTTAVNTAVDRNTLSTIADLFCTIPSDFTAHKKLYDLIQTRHSMVHGAHDAKHIDWSMAEQLSFASLLWEGRHVRISGQDSSRGTFNQRHSVWTDQTNNKRYCPLKHLKKGQGDFEIYDSPLSEFSILGFEYGYSTQNLDALVIWEAQFGDFANCAQVIIDQFITTGEQKWGVTSNLVMFLPHGHEGQGPEHSSARIERFLQLAGDLNIQLVNPTTPAQLFHLLRRQTLLPLKKPLIVFTPKGLLRHPECVSSLDDLCHGTFEEIIPDSAALRNVDKVILCSGRIYYDLIKERASLHDTSSAIIRLEQLYPLNKEKIRAVLSEYKQCTHFVWMQEEPSNMGAWEFIRPHLTTLLPEKATLQYCGRKRSASPAAGSYALHKKEEADIIHATFGEKQKEFIALTRGTQMRG